MSLEAAIRKAESLLPGVPAPEGQIDSRWQAIIAVGEYIENEPEAVWSFVSKWGGHSDADVRMAVATCLLEHLLEHHFDRFCARVEALAKQSPNFAATVSHCWSFGAAMGAY